MKKENVVLVDAHTFKVEGYVARRLKLKYGITTTVTLHGTSFDRNFKTQNGKNQIKKIFNRVDYAICVSNKIEKQLKQLNINNTKVVYNGISQIKTDNIKHPYSVISVGNLVKLKNFDIVINSVAKLSERYENIKLTIVGAGIEKDNLMKLTNSLNVSNRVVFTGRLKNENALKLMSENQIFLLPSTPEGFGIVYAEAMKASCITIGTKNEGIDGFIINEQNGFLIEPNEKEIVKLISDIYSGKYNIDNIRQNAYDTAKNLTWGNNAKEYIKLLKTN